MRLPAAAALAIALGLSASANSAEPGPYLEPEDGAFSIDSEPYERLLGDLLLGRERRPHCQMVIVPSFSSESAVYVLEGDEQTNTTAKIVSTEIEHHLWSAMTTELQKTARNGSFSMSATSQEAALAKLSPKVLRNEADVDPGTAKLLAQVWRKMLSRVAYPPDDLVRIGLDGETYHAAHCENGRGCRSGRTWSPSEGAVAFDFVQLALEMQRYARAKTDEERKHLRGRINTKARALLSRLASPRGG
jgi:hypothetical protein